MRSSALTLTAITAAAVTAAATGPGFSFPASVPLEERQIGGNSYKCHANCGYSIQKATGDFCHNSDWLELFHGCMKCALKYDIWKDYKDGVTAAADTCSIDATPVPVVDDEGDRDSTTTAAHPTTPADTASAEQTSGAVTSTTTLEGSSHPSTSSAIAVHTLSTSVEPTRATDTIIPSATRDSNGNTSIPTIVPNGVAPKTQVTGSLIAAAAFVMITLFI